MLTFVCSPARSTSLEGNRHWGPVVLFLMTIKRTVSRGLWLAIRCEPKLSSPGCEGNDLNCLPLEWPAFAQYLDKAGIDWRSYQASYNWATNSGLFYFKAFQEAAKNSSLYQRGLAFDGDNSLDSFKAAAANGTLPEVSWVFPPGALQEHPPNTPNDAAWFMHQIVNAAIHGKNANETVILINYDGK